MNIFQNMNWLDWAVMVALPVNIVAQMGAGNWAAVMAWLAAFLFFLALMVSKTD